VFKGCRYVFAAAGLSAAVLLGAGSAHAADTGKGSFTFNAPLISGFGTNAISLTGGGAYGLPGFVHAGGSFSCLSDIDAPPQFHGCQQNQGVRWDSSELLPSADFKCTGAASEVKKTKLTTAKTVALVADFYRQSDGNDESFTARMIVSETDIAPDDFPGANIWVQGVGCGHALVNFN